MTHRPMVRLLTTATLPAACGGMLAAHHSFAVFDRTQTVTVRAR